MAWFSQHLHQDLEHYALARRLSGSAESAQEIRHLALQKVLDEDNWRRVINPDAYVKRLIFDIAVARMEATLLPASSYLADQDVGPLPEIPASIDEMVITMNAMQQMRGRNRKILSTWAGRRSFKDIARKLHIERDKVSGHVAKAMSDFNNRLETEFCNPARVCQVTDSFFGAEARRCPVVRRRRAWWKLSWGDLSALLSGGSLGALMAAGIGAIYICAAHFGEWFG
jgi:DNA-binding CsgD family transcriptional regulator